MMLILNEKTSFNQLRGSREPFINLSSPNIRLLPKEQNTSNKNDNGNDNKDDNSSVMVGTNTRSMDGPPLMFSSWKPMMVSSLGEVTRANLGASKSHKEAERRRRRRINAHLATLRTLLPHLLKTDKASVLGEVVRRVKELKKVTSEITADDDNSDVINKGCLFPGDTDHVKLRQCENDSTTLVATLCCEDRPDLLVDMIRALRSIKGKVVRAEMVTIGGRTKTVLWVQGVGGSSGGVVGGCGPEGLLKRVLKVVVDKPCTSTIGQWAYWK